VVARGTNSSPAETAASVRSTGDALSTQPLTRTCTTYTGFVRDGGDHEIPALVSLDDIRLAAGRIRALVSKTPLLEVRALGAVRGEKEAEAGAGTRLWLKCECFHAAGAFKIRGACNMIAQLSPETRSAGVITYSSGNHGRAVALVAEAFRIPAVIVMPQTTPRVKVDGVRRHGAEVVFAGTTSADRKACAEDLADARGLVIIPPFDHPWIIAGQGTTGLEILEQHSQVRSIYVPVGGGGQIAGVGAAVKRMRASVRVVGVEPVGAARMTASVAAGRPVALDTTASIADGLLTLRPGDITFAHVQAFVDGIVTVTDDEIAAAVRWLFHEARIVAEPSGAAAVAAALEAREPDAVAVVSGGNVDPDAFAGYITGRTAGSR
jgi:threonine dehydratase